MRIDEKTYIYKNIEITVLQSIGNCAEQEDCFNVFRQNDKVAAVISDGVGGYPGGRKAAELTVKGCEMFFESCKNIDELIKKVNSSVVHNEKAGFATLVGIFYDEPTGSLCYFNSGDSLIFFIDENVKQLSRSHNDENDYIDLGFDSKSARYFSRLKSAIGLDLEGHPFYNHGNIKMVDKQAMVVLLSDGAYDLVEDDFEKLKFLRTSIVRKRFFESLLKRNIKNADDNVTAVVMRFIEDKEAINVA